MPKLFSKNIFSLAAFIGLIFIVTFEVSMPMDFGGIVTVQAPDTAVEAEYARCYEDKDQEMHRAVFAAIDNPDVQKEMISTNRDRIASECRQRFPEIMISVERDVSSNLIDLKPRFW